MRNMRHCLSLLAAVMAFVSGNTVLAARETALPYIELTAAQAQLVTSAQLKIEDNIDGGTVGWWTSTTDEIRWTLTIPSTGEYAVLVRIACDPRFAGSTVRVSVNTHSIDFTVPATDQWYYFRCYSIGRLALRPGTYKVVAKALTVKNQFVCNLESVIFADQSLGSFPSRLPPAASAYASAVLKDKFIWMMYDSLQIPEDVEKAASYNAQVLLRGWFTWDKKTSMGTISGWVSDLRKRGLLFDGGGTFSSLYPQNVSPPDFQDFVDRNPQNQPEHFNHKSTNANHHGDIQKIAYRNTLFKWVYDQIDYGADTLFLDEVQGAGSIYTGYSDNGMSEFTKYLMDKYVTGRGWSDNDARWNGVLDIDLAKDTKDGTIKTFDYRKYLARKGFASNPLAHTFPLIKEWGNPWVYLFSDSYLNRRNQTFWKYMVDAIRTYCAQKNKRVLIAANGLNDYVDYQIEGVWDRWQVTNGHLDISPSYIGIWRALIEQSNTLLGEAVPLVVFHDWGDGMPFFDQVQDDDRNLWLRVYAPEVFASGAIFVWPAANCYKIYMPTAAIVKVMKTLMVWYDRHRTLYQGAVWRGAGLVDMGGLGNTVNAVCDTAAGRVVHLINKQLDVKRKLVTRTQFVIKVPSVKTPTAVIAVSPDFTGAKNLPFSWQQGAAEIVVPSLEAYTVLVLEY